MKEKWYLRTWFICLMFAMWPFFIPPVIGLILLIMQGRNRKKFEEARAVKYGKYDELDATIAKRQESLHSTLADCDAEIAAKQQEVAA